MKLWNPTELVSETLTSETPAISVLPVTRIHSAPAHGWVDWNELYKYRDLFRYLVRREIKVRYAQSAIGVGWAILQPLFTMLVFTVIFGRLAKVSSDGAPYALFSFAGLVPWMFFSNAVDRWRQQPDFRGGDDVQSLFPANDDAAWRPTRLD